jgi:hypothetical protein
MRESVQLGLERKCLVFIFRENAKVRAFGQNFAKFSFRKNHPNIFIFAKIIRLSLK